MIDNRRDMSCQEFSACMADLIAAGQDIFAHPHVKRCRLHRALLNDLEAIAKAARELLGEVDPPDTLWDGIQARLGFEHLSAPVLSHEGAGFQVVFTMKVIEPGSTEASPPSLDASSLKEKPAWPDIVDATRKFVRREGRR